MKYRLVDFADTDEEAVIIRDILERSEVSEDREVYINVKEEKSTSGTVGGIRKEIVLAAFV